MAQPEMSILRANTLELHYWFKDDTHTMDAIIQNKCEFEFLGVIKEVAANFDIEVLIETEPLADGGLRRWFKVINKSENKSPVITTALITALVTGIFVTPLATSISKVTENVVNKLFEDEELKSLEKEKLKEEIENIKLDTELKRQKLNQNNAIIKKRSNFYEALNKYPKVYQFSVHHTDETKNQISEGKLIPRESFKEYVLVSDSLEPKIIDNAIIEIISPVLKKGNYKWKGIYDGVVRSFNMKSSEFKALVQSGKIEFKNGSAINCLLEIERKLNNEGLEEITNYNIKRVNHYFEDANPIETAEGKQHRQKKEADKQQLKFAFNKGNDGLAEK